MGTSPPLLSILIISLSFLSQVNQIHRFTGRHEDPQSSWDLWVLRYPQSCSHCPVHLYTEIRVSTYWTLPSLCIIIIAAVFVFIYGRSRLLFSQECRHSAFLSEAFLLGQRHFKKTGLLNACARPSARGLSLLLSAARSFISRFTRHHIWRLTFLWKGNDRKVTEPIWQFLCFHSNRKSTRPEIWMNASER